MSKKTLLSMQEQFPLYILLMDVVYMLYSFLNFFTGFLSNSNFLTIFEFVSNSTWISVVIYDSQFNDINWSFGFNDSTLRIFSIWFGVFFNHVYTFNNCFPFGWKNFQNSTFSTFRGTGQNNYFVTFFNFQLCHCLKF